MENNIPEVTKQSIVEENIAPITPPPVDAPQQSSNLILIISGIILAILVIAASGYIFMNKKNNTTSLKPTPTKIIEVSPTQIPTVTPLTTSSSASLIKDTGVPNQKRYTNSKYKFTFIFPTKISEENMEIKEIDNKIYIYNPKYSYTTGQYIEVFQKTPTDTLDQAIQKQLLAGISPKDCFVKDTKPDTAAAFPATYQVKTLGYPVDQNSDVPGFAQSNKCPSPYQESNGLSYFLGDTKHPNVYLFFSIGQQSFMVDPKSNKPWHDTIEFLD